jgi:GMP synthase (glutamine-hydrolysing)
VSHPRLLVIQHEDDAPPAWFGDWFTEAQVEFDVLAAHHGEPVPAALAPRYDGLVVLGGEMGANDDASHPWLTATKALIARTVDTGGWFFGICLGHQLAAAALGGEVVVNPHGPAFGLRSIRHTPAGRADEVLGAVPQGAPTLQWNDDVVARLPYGAVELATSPDGSTQAARFAPRAWGVQFHPEASPDLFRSWVAGSDHAPVRPEDIPSVIAEIVVAEAQLSRVGATLAGRWCDLVSATITVR